MTKNRQPSGFPPNNSTTPERLQLRYFFQGQIQLPPKLLHGGAPLPPQLVVQMHEQFKYRKSQNQEQQPSDNGYRFMMGTVSEVIVLGQLVESVVFNAPTLMANAPNDLWTIAV